MPRPSASGRATIQPAGAAISITFCRSRPRSGSVEHHAALDWREAPAFMSALAQRDGVAAKALAFAIHTAARSGEVRGARWQEIDVEGAVWTVPADRIKAGKEHRVPLTAAALAMLGPRGAPGALLFPAPATPRGPVRCHHHPPARPHGPQRHHRHGFRSTFRDWAGETTAHPREVIEAALAHRLKDKAEAAYARGDLFTKRRKLMEDWGDYLARPPAELVLIASRAVVATTVRNAG